MIDSGRQGSCNDTVAYLSGQGISHIDYHFATHYHADHIGCLDDLVDAGARAIGPILQGFNKPICDLSRGAGVDDIVAAAVINLRRARCGQA